MIAKKGTALNKSAAIRKALAQYPDKKPAELARMLTAQHGVVFRRKAVSSIKTKQGHKPTVVRKPAAPSAAQKTPASRLRIGSAVPAATTGVAVIVTNLQAYIKRLGKEDLHRLIDTL
jgi:hypothetical protein